MRERIAAAFASVPVGPLRWLPGYRVVPNYPPIVELESYDGENWAGVLAILATIDPALIGNLTRVPSGALPVGRGASRIVTSYTFCRPGRFNSAAFSAFYAGESPATAVSETIHHVRRALQWSAAPDQTLAARVLLEVDINAHSVVDLRATPYPQLYDPGEYGESRAFGARVRAGGLDGIVYRSVRRSGGHCAAIYSISALANCRVQRGLTYRYAGGRIEVTESMYSEPAP